MNNDQLTKILVIDDNDILREYIRFVLESDGYSVDESADGDEGLSQFSTNKYAVVITDMFMPGKDGYETIHALKILNPDIHIIAMSGMDMHDHCYETTNIFKADAMLSKPFTGKELLAAVKQMQAPCGK
jgi:CheY-like chemotaxis protein